MVTGSPLFRKLLRDMRENAMQFLAMTLLCFLGTWVYSGLDGTWRLMDLTVETYFEECSLADFWVNASSLTRRDLDRIAHVDGVARVQPRTSMLADAEGLGDGVEAALEIYEGDFTLNRPYLRSGSLLSPGDTKGCLMEEQFAAAHGLQPGDSVTLKLGGQRLRFLIRGTVLSAEYTITSKESTPDPEHYGFIILSHAAVPMLPYTNALVKLAPGADADAVETALERTVPGALIVSAASHRNISVARSYAVMFRGMTYVFPVVAFSVAALIVVSTLGRMIDKERMEIGTLKALGYTNRQIRRHYLWYALLPSSVGSFIGLYVGWYTLPDVLWTMMVHNSRYPYMLRPPVSLPSYVMTFLSVALAVFICMATLRKSLSEQTAELMRPKPPRSGTRILLERWPALWRRFSFNSKMIIRNLLRNKGRTFILLVGIICCNMLIIATFGLQESITWFMRQYYGGTLAYELRVDLKESEAGTLESYRNRLNADTIEGIMVKSVSLRGGKANRACQLTVLKDDQTLIRLSADQTVLPLPDEGAVISRKLASVTGVEPGDTVEVVLIGETDPIKLEIRDFAETNSGQGLFMSQTAWEKLRKGDFAVTALLITGPDELTLHRIDEMDETDRVRYLEDQFNDGMTLLDATATAFSILSAAALGLAFVICYNMGLMNFTERVRDYATLKVLGYHQREIRSLMLRESNLTAILGVLLGIVPGVMLVDIILKTCEFESMVFVSYVSFRSIWMASVITFAFTLFVEWLLTRKVRGIDMVEALKSVE
ncbi:MAG: FtsX-like permease family protein [Oscillospiraceae bacterium]|nr:FtsX-like permease family protein [Oscillospiraceae bacterium]